MIKRIDECKNNPEKSSTTKVCEYIPCGYLTSTTWTFDDIASKHDVCRSEDCMKQFCKPLKEQAMQIIDFEKKENDVINKQSINHILIKKLSHLKK